MFLAVTQLESDDKDNGFPPNVAAAAHWYAAIPANSNSDSKLSHGQSDQVSVANFVSSYRGNLRFSYSERKCIFCKKKKLVQTLKL